MVPVPPFNLKNVYFLPVRDGPSVTPFLLPDLQEVVVLLETVLTTPRCASRRYPSGLEPGRSLAIFYDLNKPCWVG